MSAYDWLVVNGEECFICFTELRKSTINHVIRYQRVEPLKIIQVPKIRLMAHRMLYFGSKSIQFRRIVTFLIIAPYKYSYLLTYLLTYKSLIHH